MSRLNKTKLFCKKEKKYLGILLKEKFSLPNKKKNLEIWKKIKINVSRKTELNKCLKSPKIKNILKKDSPKKQKSWKNYSPVEKTI